MMELKSFFPQNLSDTVFHASEFLSIAEHNQIFNGETAQFRLLNMSNKEIKIYKDTDLWW